VFRSFLCLYGLRCRVRSRHTTDKQTDTGGHFIMSPPYYYYIRIIYRVAHKNVPNFCFCKFAYGSANDFVFRHSTVCHHIEPMQLMICFETLFLISSVLTPHSPDLNPLDYSVWGILQELVYEGRREPYANLYEF